MFCAKMLNHRIFDLVDSYPWMDGWMAHGGNRKILKRRSELIRAASEKSVPEIHCLRLGLFKLIHIILYRFPMVLVPSGYVNSSLLKKWPSRNVVDLPIDSMVDLSSSLCKRLPGRVNPLRKTVESCRFPIPMAMLVPQSDRPLLVDLHPFFR